MSKKKLNLLKHAWVALFGAFLMLLALELSWDNFPYFSEHFKSTHFIIPEAGATPGALTASAASPDVSVSAETEEGRTTRLEVRQLFADLQSGKRRSLRIAYFADSMTEGDVVTEVLRKELQGLYGGLGVGYQGIAPRDASYRISVTLAPSRNWEREDWHELKKKPKLLLGLDGAAYHVAEDSGPAHLHLDGGSHGSNPWYQRATLLWGKGDATLDVGSAQVELHGTKILNSFTLPLPPQSNLDLKISAKPQVLFYAVNVDSEAGVQLDNFTYRGNGGDGPGQIDPEMLQAFQGKLHYDLVLLHFGINALHHDETDFHWYRTLLHKSYETLKKNLPGAKIVVVSVIDRDERINGNIVTDNSLPYVLQAQSQAAADSGLWFMNLYEMTGGSGVMKGWVEAKEPLANKDYTHPNRRGGARLAKYILAALLGRPNPGPENLSLTAETANAP